MVVDNVVIDEKEAIKYLGVHIAGYKFKSSKLENSCVGKALQDWNSLPCHLRKNEIKKIKKQINPIFEEFECSRQIVYFGNMLSLKTKFSWVII